MKPCHKRKLCSGLIKNIRRCPVSIFWLILIRFVCIGGAQPFSYCRPHCLFLRITAAREIFQGIFIFAFLLFNFHASAWPSFYQVFSCCRQRVFIDAWKPETISYILNHHVPFIEGCASLVSSNNPNNFNTAICIADDWKQQLLKKFSEKS